MKDVKSVQYGDASTDSGQPVAASAAARPRPNRAAIKTTTFEIASGTEIAVRNNELIDSSKAVEGQTYAAEVTDDVRDARGDVVIPRGANAQRVIKSASSGGPMPGA